MTRRRVLAMPMHSQPHRAGLREKRLHVAHLSDLVGPSHYPVTELARVLQRDGVEPASAWVWGSGEALAARAAERLGLNRNVTKLSGGAVLVPLMGPKAACLFPYSLTKECIAFCWDVWTPDAHSWERLFQRHRIRFALMTARSAVEHWSAREPGLRTAWIAEAMDPLEGSPGGQLAHRTIHVLELGRRHAEYHAAVTPALADAGYVHLYERTPGEVVFPTYRRLLSGMLDTVVNICFPSSVTHPQRSGDVETLTRRYLESMAAGSIVVGSAPSELVDLFGYDPVVPVDWRDPAGQLLDVLRHAEQYAPLVARNYERFLEVGTWSARAPELLSTLRSWGFWW